jgi:hypothetical protein
MQVKATAPGELMPAILGRTMTLESKLRYAVSECLTKFLEQRGTLFGILYERMGSSRESLVRSELPETSGSVSSVSMLQSAPRLGGV